MRTAHHNFTSSRDDGTQYIYVCTESDGQRSVTAVVVYPEQTRILDSGHIEVVAYPGMCDPDALLRGLGYEVTRGAHTPGGLLPDGAAGFNPHR